MGRRRGEEGRMEVVVVGDVARPHRRGSRVQQQQQQQQQQREEKRKGAQQHGI